MVSELLEHDGMSVLPIVFENKASNLARRSQIYG
jgi:hypothetical protein